jgi:hypothetical protein
MSITRVCYNKRIIRGASSWSCNKTVANENTVQFTLAIAVKPVG